MADIGLEGYYNSTLTGVDGRQYGYINDDSDVEQTIIAAVNGKSIQTSIDIGAQQIVEKYVNGFKEAMGAKNIGVIVENPSTGEIIAMDGGDRYDLNNPRDLSAVYTKDEIKAMNDVETVEALNGMWSNFCVTDAYEPICCKADRYGFCIGKGCDTGNRYICMRWIADFWRYYDQVCGLSERTWHRDTGRGNCKLL